MENQYNKQMIWSARKRLLSTYLVLSILMIAILAGGSYLYITKNIKENINIQVNLEQEKINKFFDVQEVKVSLLTKQVEDVVEKGEDVIKDILREYTLANEQVIAYYVGFEDGKAYFGDGWEPPSDYDVKQTEWYQLTIHEDEAVCYTAPYVDTLTGELVITLAKQVKGANGEGIGVVGTDVYLTDIMKSVNETEITIPHYSILIDHNNNILSHENPDYMPTKETIMKYSELEVEGYKWINEALKSLDKITTYQKDYDGKTKLFIVKQLTNKWYMGVAVANEDILKEVGIVVGAIISLIMMMFIAIYIISVESIKKIAKPVKVLASDIEKITQGDLMIRNNIKEKNEIGKLAFSLNYMVHTTGDIIKGTQDLAEDVEKGMQNMVIASEGNSEAMSTITSLITEMTDDNGMQLEKYEKTNREMQNLVEDFVKLQEFVSGVTENITQTRDLSYKGKEIIEDLYQSSESVGTAVKDTASKIDLFYAQIEEVRKISEYITTIANQTQILSLNASIEAARSGENGKGFEVIAKEISALSLLTKKSNDQIKSVLNALGRDIEIIVEATNNVNTYIGKQYHAVENTKEIFNKIDKNLDNSVSEVGSTVKIMQNAIGANEEVSEDMKRLKVVLGQNNGKLQEITAMTEEQLSNSVEINKKVEELNQLCLAMKNKMKVFKIS